MKIIEIIYNKSYNYNKICDIIMIIIINNVLYNMKVNNNNEI